MSQPINDHPLLSTAKPEAPKTLLALALKNKAPRVALVNAGATTPLLGIREAAEAGLAEPILIGDQSKIEAAAQDIDYDISGLLISLF